MWWLHFSNNQFFFQSIAIFQHHQRKEFTFHNSYIILELVRSVVIFWTELSCWCKSYSNKAMLHLQVIATKILQKKVTKYPYLKWQWIFYFLCIVDIFFPLSLPRLSLSFTGLDCYMSNTAGVL
jgi:hypothetical protein